MMYLVIISVSMRGRQTPLKFPPTLSKRSRWCAFLFIGAAIFNTVPVLSLRADQIVDLKDEYRQDGKQLIQRLEQCTSIQKKFSEYDLYRSVSSSKIYGVDLRGRIWTIKRDPVKGCGLQANGRLNTPEYTFDLQDRRIWSTFYYEDSKLCLYSREPKRKVAKRCYEPAGIVNKFAPYFLN